MLYTHIGISLKMNNLPYCPFLLLPLPWASSFHWKKIWWDRVIGNQGCLSPVLMQVAACYSEKRKWRLPPSLFCFHLSLMFVEFTLIATGVAGFSHLHFARWYIDWLRSDTRTHINMLLPAFCTLSRRYLSDRCSQVLSCVPSADSELVRADFSGAKTHSWQEGLTPRHKDTGNRRSEDGAGLTFRFLEISQAA